MSLSYKIKKARVRFKHRMIRKRNDIAMKNLSIEQLRVIKQVTEYAVKHNEAIKFDPKSDEILIILPEVLVTLKGETIYIHNTHGFLPMPIPTEAYEMLVEVIEKEAHKERRKLKYEVKQRIHKFLDQLTEH